MPKKQKSKSRKKVHHIGAKPRKNDSETDFPLKYFERINLGIFPVTETGPTDQEISHKKSVLEQYVGETLLIVDRNLPNGQLVATLTDPNYTNHHYRVETQGKLVDLNYKNLKKAYAIKTLDPDQLRNLHAHWSETGFED